MLKLGMVTMVEGEKIQRRPIPIPKPRASQAAKRLRKCFIPFETIRNSHVVWLGAHSKDTIPISARDLLKRITFIDTAVDCIEHITSLIIPQRSIILIISDEYATDRKAIAQMLDLNEIRVIYVVLDRYQQGSIDWFFGDSRIEPIFNDTFTVLNQLIHENTRKSTHFGEQIPNVHRPTAEKDRKSIDQLVSVEKCQKSVRIEQMSPSHFQTERSVRNERMTTAKKVEEPSLSSTGFVTTGYQHFVMRMAPISE